MTHTTYKQLQTSAWTAFNQSNDGRTAQLLLGALDYAIQHSVADESIVILGEIVGYSLARKGELQTANRVLGRCLTIKQLLFGAADSRVVSSLEKLVWLRSTIAADLFDSNIDRAC